MVFNCPEVFETGFRFYFKTESDTIPDWALINMRNSVDVYWILEVFDEGVRFLIRFLKLVFITGF